MSDLDFIETCHDVSAGDDAWGRALAARLARLVPEASHVMAAPYRIDGEGGRFLEISGNDSYLDDPSLAARSRASWAAVNRSPLRPMILAHTYASSVPHVLALSSLPAKHGNPIRGQLPGRAWDCLGVFATLDGERGYKLAPVGRSTIAVQRRRRAQLQRLCEHVATGYWLRSLRPARPPELDAEAVYAPDGRLLHDTGAGGPAVLGQLVDAVRGMDRARCRRKKRTPDEATRLWQALVAGQYTLVESTERNGRRLILAVRCRTPRPALTEREAAVAASAARGAANKAIAAELGMATGTVGVHLATAMRKLGCPNRRALAQWLVAGGGVRS